MQADIVIFGGGLAGCAAAVCLARAGRDVVLVEREAAARHKVCGEFLSEEALGLLAHLGIEPGDHGAQRIHTVRLASAGRVTEAALPFPAQSLTRRCLDGLLLAAAERAGARVLRGTGAASLLRSGERWDVALSTGEVLCAPRVVLATGKHDLRGFLRPQGVQGDLLGMKMYFRLRAEQRAALAHSVELLLHPQGYTGLQPVEGEMANLTALVHRRHLAALGGWPGLLAEICRRNPHAARRLEGAEPLLEKPLAISSIPYGFVRRQAPGPNLWAVGDQAAVIPSFTGDGMSLALYTGVRAAQSVLGGQTAERFQHEVHGALRWQVARATALSRAMVQDGTKHLLAGAARVWPGGLRVAASLTRLPRAALNKPRVSPPLLRQAQGPVERTRNS